MLAIRQIIAVGVLFAAAGCAHTSQYVGVWEGRRNVKTVPGTDPSIVGSLTRVSLVVKDDGSFELFDRGLPMSGHLDSRNGTDELHVEVVVGRAGTIPGANDYSLHLMPSGDLDLGTADPVRLVPQPKPAAP